MHEREQQRGAGQGEKGARKGKVVEDPGAQVREGLAYEEGHESARCRNPDEGNPKQAEDKTRRAGGLRPTGRRRW